MKIVAIKRSTEIRLEETKQEKELRNLPKLLADEETKTPGLFIADMRSVKDKIESIEAEKCKGAAIKARSEIHMTGEMRTKRSLSDEKRHAKNNDMDKIEYKGCEVWEQDEIEKAFFERYNDLFFY